MRSSGMRNSSAVRVPVRPIATASRSPRSAIRAAKLGSIDGGATLSTRMPASWTLCDTGYVAVCPSSPRMTMIETSSRKASSRSARIGDPGVGAMASHAAGSSSGRLTRTWPGRRSRRW